MSPRISKKSIRHVSAKEKHRYEHEIRLLLSEAKSDDDTEEIDAAVRALIACADDYRASYVYRESNTREARRLRSSISDTRLALRELLSSLEATNWDPSNVGRAIQRVPAMAWLSFLSSAKHPLTRLVTEELPSRRTLKAAIKLVGEAVKAANEAPNKEPDHELRILAWGVAKVLHCLHLPVKLARTVKDSSEEASERSEPKHKRGFLYERVLRHVLALAGCTYVADIFPLMRDGKEMLEDPNLPPGAPLR